MTPSPLFEQTVVSPHKTVQNSCHLREGVNFFYELFLNKVQGGGVLKFPIMCVFTPSLSEEKLLISNKCGGEMEKMKINWDN